MAETAASPVVNGSARVELPNQGGSLEIPIMDGTVGPRVLDIRRLYSESGLFTFDPGFTATASCESKITFIDGDAGVLLHRGYPIDQLAEHLRKT